MSKTSGKARWVSGRVLIGLSALFAALSVRASVDQPDATKLFGNAYHDGGWFSCGTSRHSDGWLLFDTKDDFVLSPRYPAPVRKIVLSVRCSSKSPTKLLLLCPFVDGVEDPARVHTNSTVEANSTFEIVSFDFAAAEGVDAFRLLLGGSGSTGNWGVDAISVFYGTKTPDEDEILRQFAQQLPVPEDLSLTGLGKSSLEVSASPVADAAGYCFELTKLTGSPRTEIREDFASWANRLSEGWSFGETNAVKLSDYSGENAQLVDKSRKDYISLRIERNEKVGGDACVEILSPKAPDGEVFHECSFWCKRAAGENSSDQIAVFGASDDSKTWKELGEPTPVTTTGTCYRVAISNEWNISRVKFVFTANVQAFPNCAIDSLCVVYGGNEMRELVSVKTNETPTAVWQDLASGRYGYRVKALGATEGEKQFKDSAWTEEQSVDLSWADVSLSPPEDLAYEVSGDKLNLSWSSVAMADHYEVKVALADDPDHPVATLVTRSASASVPVVELGDYVVTVTAVSPGGVSSAFTSLENCTVTLGKVTELVVKATAADTIAATWKDVPLAESYQAKLFRVTGTAGSVTYGWTAEDGKIILPDGWEHEKEWEGDSWKSGTKNPVYFPSLAYEGSYIASDAFPATVTKLMFKCKCGSTANGGLENSRLCIYVADEDGDWNEEPVVRQELLTSLQTIELSFALSDGIRRIKFQAEGESKRSSVNVALGEVTVSYGEYVRTEVASVGTKECEATYRGLDRTAKYVVVVTSQPSEGPGVEESSAIVDLAAEYFRPVGPVSIAGCKGVYLQDFGVLASVTKETELVRVPLENWQFFKGSGEAEKLYYTSGTNSTTGGVYCYSDAQRTTNSFMIGTVAVSTTGSSVGLAFANDTGTSLGAPTLTFTAVRRNEKPGDPYRLEWLVTDGPWSIGTESGGWQPLPLMEDEPEFSVTPEDCRLAPGQVIIFRWRQEKVKGGPMLGLDNVHVEFPVDKSGCMLYLR